jgi:hypothetical protein
VTEEQLLAALRAANIDQHADGWSRKEMEKILGLGSEGTLDVIRRMVDKGIMEFAGRRATVGIDGRRVVIPVYRMAGGGKAS